MHIDVCDIDKFVRFLDSELNYFSGLIVTVILSFKNFTDLKSRKIVSVLSMFMVSYDEINSYLQLSRSSYVSKEGSRASNACNLIQEMSYNC